MPVQAGFIFSSFFLKVLLLLWLLKKIWEVYWEIVLENKNMVKWSNMSDSFECDRIWSRKMNRVMNTHVTSVSVLSSSMCNMFLLSATKTYWNLEQGMSCDSWESSV